MGEFKVFIILLGLKFCVIRLMGSNTMLYLHQQQPHCVSPLLPFFGQFFEQFRNLNLSSTKTLSTKSLSESCLPHSGCSMACHGIDRDGLITGQGEIQLKSVNT